MTEFLGMRGAARRLLSVLLAGSIALVTCRSASAQESPAPSDPREAGTGGPTTVATPAAPENGPSAPGPAVTTDQSRPAEPEPQTQAPSAPAPAPETAAQPPGRSTTAASPQTRRAAPGAPCACPCAAEAKTRADGPVDANRPESGYGWTIVIADLSNVATHMLIGAVADPDKYKKVWPYTVGGIYVLTGPVVHWAKGRPDRAWKSLGLRVGMPLATGIVGLLVASDQIEDGLPRGALIGAGFGVATAIILDAAILGSSENTEGPGTDVGTIQGVGTWVDLERRSVGASLAYAL